MGIALYSCHLVTPQSQCFHPHGHSRATVQDTHSPNETKIEGIWIRTCSSPLADRPGISGATISAWFTKIPVPLSKLEPDPSNGEYANLNIGWEKLKIYNAMLPCVTSLDGALGSVQSTYLACAWIPIAVVLRWLMMLASDLVDILRILPRSSCGSIPSSRDLPPPKNDSTLKPTPVKFWKLT